MNTGNSKLDLLLDGGYSSGECTLIYGQPGSGKTLLCLLLFNSNSQKTVYIDCKKDFSDARLSQLGVPRGHYDKLILVNPKSFAEQFDFIKSLLTSKIKNLGALVADNFTSQYRLEKHKQTKEDFMLNKNIDLIRMLKLLKDIAKTYNIPVLITSEVYDDLKDSKLKIPYSHLITGWASTVIELKKIDEKLKKAILRKHKILPKNSFVSYEIVEDGIE